MATRTWTAGGGANNNWSNSANWNTGVPTTADVASLDVGTLQTYGVNLDASVTIQSITIAQIGGFTAATFAMNSNNISLNLTGTIFNNNSTGSGALTFTGTGEFISTNNATSSRTFSVGTNFTVGPNISISATSNATLVVTGKINNLNIPDTYIGSLTNTVRTLTGSLRLSANMQTPNSGNNATTIAPTSGTVTINTNGETVDFPININPSSGATVQLLGNVTNVVSTTRTLTMGGDGTFDLNGFTFATSRFLSASTNTSRTIAFGSTGVIECRGSGAVVDFYNSVSNTVMPLITGSGLIKVTNPGTTAVTITFANTTGASSSSRAPSFEISGSSNAYTCTFGQSGGITNLEFKSTFVGTWAGFSANTPIYGNLTLSSGMTVSSSSTTLSFVSTGTQTFDSANKTNLGCNITLNGGSSSVLRLVGNSVGFASGNTLTWNAGGIDLNTFTFTSPSTISTTTGTGSNLLFNGGTFVYPGASFTPATDFVTTAGTGTGTLSLTNTNAVYNTSVTLNAVLQFATNLSFNAGNHTIGGLRKDNASGGTVTFPASTTTTITGDITLVGVSGGLINIVSGTVGTRATLSKSSGIVSVTFVSVKDSAGTGGASWQAYVSNGNTDAGNNTGWLFAPAAVSSTNFLIMF
jgi:hypothetical protein